MSVYDNQMEQQDEMIDMLSGEITKIKYIAIAINDETDEQNVLLDDMNDNVANTNTRLNNTNKRIDKLMSYVNNKYTCLIIVLIIILVVLMILYFS
jgi:blocked-early-in-transport protein 1